MKPMLLTPFIAIALAFTGIVQKAAAQSAWCPNCWYVSGYAGPVWHREMDTQTTDPNGVIATDDRITNYRTGYGVGGAIGAVFCRSWRLEVEGYFRRSNGKQVVSGSDVLSNLFTLSTHYFSFSLMVNGFYDFCLCESVAWYVGGGIGPSWVEYKFIANPPNSTVRIRTREVRFSYQIMTGIAYKFCNHISATVGYRLWGTTKDRDGIESHSFAPITGVPPFSLKASERRVPLVNSLEFGLRYAF